MVRGGRKNIFSTIVDIEEGRYYLEGGILSNKETLGCYVGMYYKNMGNLEAFCWIISSSIYLLFLNVGS